jgi:sec-independent protein translocase protein TatB
MFDFDAGKLLILGIVALVVIGPKELPGVMRQVGQAVAKLRRMAAEFQGQFMEAMREAELDNLKQELTKVGEVAKEAARLDDFNPLSDAQREITAALSDPPSASAPSVATLAPAPAPAAALASPPATPAILAPPPTAPAPPTVETAPQALPPQTTEPETAPVKPVRRKRTAKATEAGEVKPKTDKPPRRRRPSASASKAAPVVDPGPRPPAEGEG